MPPVPEPMDTHHPSQSSQPSSSRLRDPASGHVHVNPQSTPYDNPASLLRIIPLSNYAPTARGLFSPPHSTAVTSTSLGSSLISSVAQHIATHTVTYAASSLSNHLYRQHSQTFQAMDRPQSQQDWQLRQEAESRIAGMLQSGGPGYGR